MEVLVLLVFPIFLSFAKKFLYSMLEMFANLYKNLK